MPLIKPLKRKDFTLRPFRKGDAESLKENINNKRISRTTLGVPYPYTLNNARAWIKKVLKEQRKKKPEMVNLVIDIDGEVAGSVSFFDIKEKHKAEIAYWLAEKHWGKGLMTKVVKEATKFAFEKLKLRRIEAYVFSFNKPSMRVLEKAGYRLEGVLRKESKKDGKFIDSHLFAKVR